MSEENAVAKYASIILVLKIFPSPPLVVMLKDLSPMTLEIIRSLLIVSVGVNAFDMSTGSGNIDIEFSSES